MKRLTITVLAAGLFAGSLFASENNTMMGMDKEKCMAMHKSMQVVFNILCQHQISPKILS